MQVEEIKPPFGKNTGALSIDLEETASCWYQ
jgi:uncharacterized protein (DUF3820 family)